MQTEHIRESFLDTVAPPEARTEAVSRDFNHRGTYSGGGVTMEKPKTEKLFAHPPNMEENVSYVSLCSLHLEHPSDTTCQALEYKQFTFCQRSLVLLSGYLSLKAGRFLPSINRNEAGVKTEHGSRQPSRRPAWLLNAPCKMAHRDYHPAINFSSTAH